MTAARITKLAATLARGDRIREGVVREVVVWTTRDGALMADVYVAGSRYPETYTGRAEVSCVPAEPT